MTTSESVITAVERQRRAAGRYLIYIDGQYAFTVHEDILVKHRLTKGERVDEQKMRLVLEDEEQQRAWSDALKQVGRRPRSEKEIRQYLRRKQVLPTLIDRIVVRLKEQRYIDDADFAAQWTEQRIFSQKKGRRLIKQELQHKGIAPATIQETLNQVPAEEEDRLAYELGLKKWKQTAGGGLDKQRKTAAYLLRRGYSNQTVSGVIRRLRETFREEAGGEDGEEWDWSGQ